jgi:hypothetical protein
MTHSSGASRPALVHRAAQPGEGGAALPAASSAWATGAADEGAVCAGWAEGTVCGGWAGVLDFEACWDKP